MIRRKTWQIKPQAKASFDVFVNWEGADGKSHTAPVESWVKNLATEAPVSRGHWLYTGSKLDDAGGFAAETDGSILATYRDLALSHEQSQGKVSFPMKYGSLRLNRDYSKRGHP